MYVNFSENLQLNKKGICFSCTKFKTKYLPKHAYTARFINNKKVIAQFSATLNIGFLRSAHPILLELPCVFTEQTGS